MRLKFFEETKLFYPTQSKIVQINDNEIYVVGGGRAYPTLLASKYDVYRECLRIDIKTGKLTLQASMISGRRLHDVQCITNQIYVVGGEDQNRKSVRTCERYFISKDEWQ